MFMGKRAISVTLETANLTWLRGQVGATGLRSVSELLDRLVTQARAAGPIAPARSVIGTIDLNPEDPLLERADAAVRAVYEQALRRPLLVKEQSPRDGAPRRRVRKTRG